MPFLGVAYKLIYCNVGDVPPNKSVSTPLSESAASNSAFTKPHPLGRGQQEVVISTASGQEWQHLLADRLPTPVFESLKDAVHNGLPALFLLTRAAPHAYAHG